LNAGVPFGFFSRPAVETKREDQKKLYNDSLSTWRQQQLAELELSITHPPANVFEEMILWTNQNKLWRFPIDNEIGIYTIFSIHLCCYGKTM
jgi:hypothetical protein